MGQIIEVKSTKLNKTVIFDLNRSVSGQEGMTFHNISEASLIPDVSGQLALKLFQETSDIDTIFIQSNIVTCLLYTSPSPRDVEESRMPSSA